MNASARSVLLMFAALAAGCAQSAYTPMLEARPLPLALTHNAPIPWPAAQTQRGKGWLSPEASSGEDLLYIGHGDEVLIYPQKGPHQKPIGAITDGVSGAFGLATDEARTLYVSNANNGTVTIYPAGQLDPSLVLSTGLSSPTSVAVGPDGTVYVCDSDGHIVEYPKGQVTPSLVIPVVLDSSSGVAIPTDGVVDRAGDLYVSYLFFPSPRLIEDQIARYPHGSDVLTWTGIYAPYGGDLAFDAQGNLLLAEPETVSYRGGVGVYRLKGHAQIGTFGDPVDPWAMRFAWPGGRVYVGDPELHKVFVYTYPNHKLVNTIVSGAKDSVGIALSPPGPR